MMPRLSGLTALPKNRSSLRSYGFPHTSKLPYRRPAADAGLDPYLATKTSFCSDKSGSSSFRSTRMAAAGVERSGADKTVAPGVQAVRLLHRKIFAQHGVSKATVRPDIRLPAHRATQLNPTTRGERDLRTCRTPEPCFRIRTPTARYHPGMTDLQILLKAIEEDLGDPIGWSDPVEFRGSLALCALNSAYSLRATSNSVKRVIARYRAVRPTADTDSGPDLIRAMDDASGPGISPATSCATTASSPAPHACLLRASTRALPGWRPSTPP
jgi:hypothetical protein